MGWIRYGTKKKHKTVAPANRLTFKRQTSSTTLNALHCLQYLIPVLSEFPYDVPVALKRSTFIEKKFQVVSFSLIFDHQNRKKDKSEELEADKSWEKIGCVKSLMYDQSSVFLL